MPRRPDEIADLTSLAGSRIDVAGRIGWLLRAWRVTAGISLRDLAGVAGAGHSPATLSRVETAGRRSGVVTAAYERALGLPYGHLRAPIEVLCRTFAYSPEDVELFTPPAELEAFSTACAAVEDEPTGHDWLRFAEYHARSPYGMPAPTIRPLIVRLASEVGRSQGTAYQLRYEALSTLRCSAYGGLVADVIRDAVVAPGAQRPSDLVSAVTERPSAELVAWCGELLAHDSWQVARAACLGLQNMRSVGGLRRGDWAPLVPAYSAACTAAAGDSLREPILSSTLAALPPEFRASVASTLGRQLPPPRRAVDWSRSQQNRHFAYAAELAAGLTGSHSSESMLTRLLFEVLYDFRATHVVTSSFLLTASPYSDAVGELMCAAALGGPDEITRHGAASAFANLMVPFDHFDAGPWLASDDPVLRGAGLTACGFAGIALAEDVLRGLLAQEGEVRRDALFSAAMSGHPALPAIAADPSFVADVRQGAQWWLAEGGRVDS